ncbi:hypothetical protein NEF87_004791 [Candidatus Lokiarchaeum ossiferum]|uniref:CARDB domain-containing protein n=1 Tax=Candidatus Lokiarchaeum ossiferum TaxID=2951803 RepID=A0ABY6HY99_9ARCH|nr:hypothetical protein NEF87_004791 [Candidatus Lokiarchaeum sp. B-35]
MKNAKLIYLTFPFLCFLLINCLDIVDNNPMGQIEEVTVLSASTTLYDSVELFRPPQTSQIFNVSFIKNVTYFFFMESYVPFADDFSVNIYCTSPSARQYHFFDYTADIENNASKIFFEFGSTETGVYSIRYDVLTTANINLHLYLEEYLSIDTYYEKFSTDLINRNILFFSSIDRFSTNQLSHTYEMSFQEDTEYHFNFFRVNPISLTDIEVNGFTNPQVSMQVELNGTQYIFYPSVPTLEYALYSNIENLTHIGNPNERNLYNNSFLIRFGAHITGNATITLTLSDYNGFDLNFAFVAYGIGDIGDGPDTIGDKQDHNNNFINVTIIDDLMAPNATDLQEVDPTVDDKINYALGEVENFLEAQFWILLPSVLGAAGVFYAISHFKPNLKVQTQVIPDGREILED